MKLSLALRFQRARSGGLQERGALIDLLHPEARYATLGREVAGAQAVADELLAGGNAELARRLDWQPPQAVGEEVRLTGLRRADSRDRGLVVTLGFEGSTIVRLQEQRTPAPPAEAQPLRLPEALKRRIDQALVERHPMLLAHVGPDAQPVLSFRGSVQAFGDAQLALWIRAADGHFLQAIRGNPRVALMYRDEGVKATYQFQGRARVTDVPAERQRIFERAPAAERAHDFAMLGVAVVVDLDRVEGYAGLGPQGQVDAIRMLRDAQPR